ncbi:MAG: DUF771 domain-containing protein [Solibacillus isronensis]
MKILQLKTEVTINLPDHLVIIEKVEYENLNRELLVGRYWTMAELEERIGKKQVWIKENILYQPKFKKQLDVLQGGFVYYPKTKGEKWSFHATKMANFLEDNFYKIFNP